MTATVATASRPRLLVSEMRKLPAFGRREFLETLTYRMALFWDIVGLAFQAVTFFFISKLVNPAALPTYGDSQVTYIEFVAVGIPVSMFVTLALLRAASAFREAQLAGTLEVLLMTPTAPTTIQLGLVFYDLIYMPLRTAVFFAVLVFALDVRFDAAGVLPATVVLLLFVPFVWGLGIVLSAATITFKQGGAGFLGSILVLTSGAYFPVTLFSAGLFAKIAELNPMTVTIDALRDLLLGGSGWSEVGEAATVLVPAAAVTLALGIVAFRLAARRERRRGTIGLY